MKRRYERPRVRSIPDVDNKVDWSITVWTYAKILIQYEKLMDALDMEST